MKSAPRDFLPQLKTAITKNGLVCAFLRAIIWKNCKVIGQGNILCGLTTNGAFALFGRRTIPPVQFNYRLPLNRIARSLFEEPMHLGEVLKELYFNPVGTGTIAFARHLGVPSKQVEQPIEGINSMTPDMALRLARAFNMTPAYCMNMHANYDMAEISKEVWCIWD